jgi:ribosome-binding factor A
MHKKQAVNRNVKVGSELVVIISNIIRNKVKNPIIATTLITVKDVEVTKDLSIAKVYVSVLEDSISSELVNHKGERLTAANVVAELNTCAKYIHHEIANEIISKKIPFPIFYHDTTDDVAMKITKLLNDL